MSNRSRCLLHKRKLVPFKVFCESRGWIVEPNKGPYDALRLRHPNNREPVIVYERGTMPEHLTVYGTGLELVRAFLLEPRKRRPGASFPTSAAPSSKSDI